MEGLKDIRKIIGYVSAFIRIMREVVERRNLIMSNLTINLKQIDTDNLQQTDLV
tara:strand:- start:661 stop:822 length:162 start_codon:yes stop_codon:yes gene_type:complete